MHHCDNETSLQKWLKPWSIHSMQERNMSVLSYHPAVSRATSLSHQTFNYLTMDRRNYTMHKMQQDRPVRLLEVNRLSLRVILWVRLCVCMRKGSLFTVGVRDESIPTGYWFMIFHTSSPTSMTLWEVQNRTASHGAGFTLQQIIVYLIW